MTRWARLHGRRGRWARRPPPGSAPGTLVAPPKEAAIPPSIKMIAYGPERLEERTLATLSELDRPAETFPVTWIDVQGLGDLDVMRAVGQHFGLHPLALADIVHANQRPKVEAYEEHLFIVLRMPHLDDGLRTEQLSLIVGKDFVLTLQEHAGDCFDPVRARLRRDKSRMRTLGADYLAYALLDTLIDSYFPVLEHFGEALETLERAVVERPDPDLVPRIHTLKRDLLELRRGLWPMREIMSHLLRDETAFIGAATRVYLRDCADHVFQLMDMLEIDREVASGLTDLHLSSVSLRMNEIMKLLTIIATIFIPLGVIAGVYGMNFRPEVSPFNMPELTWYFGYPFALGLMLAVAGGLLGYFWRKGWIGGRRS
jgi:magnesium transporter